MTFPSPQEARSRQTAMEAERWWWVQKLRQRVAELAPCAVRDYLAGGSVGG